MAWPVGVSLVTRSPLVLRDLDLLRELDSRGALRITVPVPPSPRALTLGLEPGFPPALERLELVARLAKEGMFVGVLASPVIPGGGDERRSLGHLVCAADAAGAKFLRVAPLRLGPGRAQILARIAEADPICAARVERVFRRGAWSPRFAEQVRVSFASLLALYRLEAEPPYPEVSRRAIPRRPGRGLADQQLADQQLGLFGVA